MNNPNEHAADLLKRGFVELQEFRHIHVGDRVHHVNERWPEAYAKGTGTVERIFHHPDSAWERRYGRPDVELIVRRDKPKFGPDDTHAFLADYHVDIIEQSGRVEP